ncbi:ABC transporter ATP-binding protein [Weissella koreensis]|uniref:ABC transporter ATP-binding protein n=1 Tax=Weissella koreensis TaxID=165096 RepID=UPI0022BA2E69|nr:ABC transporter ATP-binding protein [Weissella koreensis]MCZ9311425.1 ABC transporter ATP-binding protein [Weissella koreensis]
MQRKQGQSQFEKRPQGGTKSLVKIIKMAHPQWGYMITGLLLSLVGVFANLLAPKYSGNLINSFMGKQGADYKLIGIVLALFMGGALISALGSFLTSVAGEQLVKNLRSIIWERLAILKVRYFDQTKSGEITSRLTNDTTQVKRLVANDLPNFVTSFLQMLGAIVLMFSTDWHLALWILLAAPVTLLFLMPIMMFSRKVGHATQDAMADFSGVAQETLAEMRLVKSSGAEEQIKTTGNQSIERLFHFGRKEAVIDGTVGPVMNLVMMGLFVVILFVGALRIAHGQSTMGTLFSFLMYLFQIMPAFMSIGTFSTTYAKTQGSTQRLTEILDESAEDFDKGQFVELEGKTLSMQNVNFGYSDSEEILHNITMEAKPNTIVAFVGPSGGGKTTIFQLLERFYDPNSGVIKIGNQSIENINLKNWRQQIGFVSQDSAIMAGTIRDNLTYGSDATYTDDQLWHVLQLAYADKFVKKMPNQLETQVGERGIMISGGQRQRLAIARAFLRDPKILMLDEATASLDSESEAMVQKALEQLMKNRTTLVIAHRLATIVDADQIYFVEQGTITGSGSHAELLKTHPLYKEYVQEQLVTQ